MNKLFVIYPLKDRLELPNMKRGQILTMQLVSGFESCLYFVKYGTTPITFKVLRIV